MADSIEAQRKMPAEFVVTELCICVAVLKALEKDGLIGGVDEFVELTDEGNKRGDIRAAKYMSEGYFRSRLLTHFTPENAPVRIDAATADGIAKLARDQHLIADLDEGLDWAWIERMVKLGPADE